MNKVQFNLKNAHYAVIDKSTDTFTFGTPVAIPGAVNLSLDPQGEVTPFYADGMIYYQSVANNGYSGDLEVAKFPDEMLQDVWGYELTETDKVLVENAHTEPNDFALLFQIDGDKDNEFYCMYNCAGTRPNITSTTNTETKTPQTQKSTISATPLPSGHVLARTTSETTASVKTNWFKQVYQQLAASTQS